MAVDAFMMFMDYNSQYLKSESSVDFSKDASNALSSDFIAQNGSNNVFEVDSFNFGIEQIVTIGSQAGGAGAGKVTFKEFNIERKIDVSSPVLFKNACSGKSFQNVSLGFRKASGDDSSGTFYLRFDFKLVAVKTIDWAHDEESPKETMTLMYGGLLMRYLKQKPDGTMDPTVYPGGWNRVKNIVMEDPNTVIK
jgi:type VI secretion system secreted protein Hcp